MGLSLQEDCHSFLYLSVGILLDASHTLHFGDARGVASSHCRVSAVYQHSLGESNWIVGPNSGFCESVRLFVCGNIHGKY